MIIPPATEGEGGVYWFEPVRPYQSTGVRGSGLESSIKSLIYMV